MAKGTIVIIKPDGSEERQRVESSKGWELETMQKAVGGLIERVKVRWEGRVRDAFVNEEGAITEGFDYNNKATHILALPFSPLSTRLYGNLAIWIPDAKHKPDPVKPFFPPEFNDASDINKANEPPVSYDSKDAALEAIAA